MARYSVLLFVSALCFLMTSCGGSSSSPLSSSSIASEAGSANLSAKWRIGSLTDVANGDVLVGQILDESAAGNNLNSNPVQPGMGPLYRAKTAGLNSPASAVLFPNVNADFTFTPLTFTSSATVQYSIIFVIQYCFQFII